MRPGVTLTIPSVLKRLIIIVWFVCAIAGIGASACWIRSYWRDDIASIHGLDMISGDRWLLIGQDSGGADLPTHESGPTNKGWFGRVAVSLFWGFGRGTGEPDITGTVYWPDLFEISW